VVRAGALVALATVLKTWGSAPRRAGSHLAVRGDGHFVGSVSGGCVERAVVEVAQRLIGTGAAEIVEYGVTTEDAWEVGLACGGTIRVAVTDLRDAVSELEAVVAAVAARRPVALSLGFDGIAPAARALAEKAWDVTLGESVGVRATQG